MRLDRTHFALLVAILLAAMQLWLSQLARGGTVILPAGIIPVQVFQNGNTYLAAPTGTTIQNLSTADFSYTANLDNLHDLTIQGVTFNGNGISCSNTTNVTLQNCRIQNARRLQGNHQGIIGGGNTNLTFDHVTWDNCTAAVMLFHAGTGLTLTDCIVNNSAYGLKLQLQPGSRNVRIVRLLCRQIQQNIGVEIQGDDPNIDGVYVGDSAYVDPILSSTDIQNAHAMGFSLPMAMATNVVVERCYVDGYSPALGYGTKPGFIGLRNGFEIGGNKCVYQNNWVAGRLNCAGSVTTSSGAYCHDNLITNSVNEGWHQNAGTFGAPPAFANNGGSVQLPAVGGWSLVGITPPTIGVPQATVDALTAQVLVLQAKIAQGLKDLGQ